MDIQPDLKRQAQLDFSGFKPGDQVPFCPKCSWQAHEPQGMKPVCPECGEHLHIVRCPRNPLLPKIEHLLQQCRHKEEARYTDKPLPRPELQVRPGVYQVGHHHFYYCQDCKTPDPALFMVKDELWASTGLRGIICLGCFEKRIGREVLLDDLKPCSVTEEMLLGFKIASRF